MKANKFIFVSFILFFLLLFLYAVFVDNLIIPNRSVPFSYKQYLLDNSATMQGKVIVESGSSGHHSFDPFILADFFKAPVIIAADNGGYPLRLKLFRILKITQPGDVLILPLEWSYYNSEKELPVNFLDSLADKNLRLEFYFNRLPIFEKIRFLYKHFPLRNVISSLSEARDDEYILNEDRKRLTIYEEILSTGTNISFGGSDSNNNGPPLKDGSHSMTCDDYVFHKQRADGFIISDEFKSNLTILKRLENKGVRIFFTWPSVAGWKSKQCYSDTKNKHKIESYAEDIRETVEHEGFNFVGKYTDSNFPSECFLNTFYHVTRECASLRTTKFVNQLNAMGEKKATREYSLKEFQKTIQESIKNHKINNNTT